MEPRDKFKLVVEHAISDLQCLHFRTDDYVLSVEDIATKVVSIANGLIEASLKAVAGQVRVGREPEEELLSEAVLDPEADY